MEQIRIFVVDDHPMIRHGLAAMIRAEPGLAWVGDAAGGHEAVRGLPPAAPDVVLMDMAMPDMDGAACINTLRPLVPKTRFIVLLSQLEPAELGRARAAGACGHLLKSASSPDLVSAIRRAQLGRHAPSPELADACPAGQSEAAAGADLTQRERELLALMARGHSNQAIATALLIAMPTVKFHVTNILAKLHADNRTEAVLVALRNKLVTLE